LESWRVALTNSPPPQLTHFEDAAMRDIVSLACTECKRRNYSTTKNKKKTTERLEFSKFCRFCRKHTSHREQK
jgi:large subunit ribosomal protein L33